MRCSLRAEVDTGAEQPVIGADHATDTGWLVSWVSLQHYLYFKTAASMIAETDQDENVKRPVASIPARIWKNGAEEYLDLLSDLDLSGEMQSFLHKCRSYVQKMCVKYPAQNWAWFEWMKGLDAYERQLAGTDHTRAGALQICDNQVPWYCQHNVRWTETCPSCTSCEHGICWSQTCSYCETMFGDNFQEVAERRQNLLQQLETHHNVSNGHYVGEDQSLSDSPSEWELLAESRGCPHGTPILFPCLECFDGNISSFPTSWTTMVVNLQ